MEILALFSESDLWLSSAIRIDSQTAIFKVDKCFEIMADMNMFLRLTVAMFPLKHVD